jgi:hypothetical protein
MSIPNSSGIPGATATVLANEFCQDQTNFPLFRLVKSVSWYDKMGWIQRYILLRACLTYRHQGRIKLDDWSVCANFA